MGRSVLTRGDHAPLEALPIRARRSPLAFRPGQLPAAPRSCPKGCWAARPSARSTSCGTEAPKARVGEIQKLSTFFHPLDGVPHWNRIYGRSGFVQYQFVVGYGQETALRRIVQRISGARLPLLPRRAQALRRRRSRLAVLSTCCRLDARPRHPANLPGLSVSSTNSTRRWPLRTGVSSLPGLLARPTCCPPCIRDWTFPLVARLDPHGVFCLDLSRRLSLERRRAPRVPCTCRRERAPSH